MRSDLRETFEHLTTARGFTKESGFHVREFEKGYVVLEAAVKESLVQFMGFVHAGVVTGLADHAAGAAYASVLPEGKVCLTIELKINGQTITEYTEEENLNRPERQLDHGTIALQAHDPGSKVYYRNLKIRKLPD